MNLFLLRHAEAVELGSHGISDDRKRSLSSFGVEQSELIASAVKSMNLNFDVILTSTYLRAKQTATIITEQCDSLPKPIYTASLGVESDIESFIDLINKRYHAHNDILAVGHNPFLSKLVSQLVSGRVDGGIEVKKGALLKLKVNGELIFERCAQLQWMLTPKVILQLKTTT